MSEYSQSGSFVFISDGPSEGLLELMKKASPIALPERICYLCTEMISECEVDQGFTVNGLPVHGLCFQEHQSKIATFPA